MQRIKAAKGVPPAMGPYSLAVIHDGIVYTAGQIGLTVDAVIVDGGVEAEAKQTMENLVKVLHAAGSDLNHALKTTIYLTDPADFAAVNKIYGSYFNEASHPARETIGAAALPLGAKIEISIIAALKPKNEDTL